MHWELTTQLPNGISDFEKFSEARISKLPNNKRRNRQLGRYGNGRRAKGVYVVYMVAVHAVPRNSGRAACYSNVGLSVDVVYYKNANKKVKLYKDTSQEERFYNRKCESDKEFNKSYVNYNSAEQYSFPSIECVTIDVDSNS